MKNNNSSIKTVVAVGIGAALFFVLGRFVAIPSPVPNTNISLQYAVLALLAAMYGPVAGGLIGFIGHTLIDVAGSGAGALGQCPAADARSAVPASPAASAHVLPRRPAAGIVVDGASVPAVGEHARDVCDGLGTGGAV